MVDLMSPDPSEFIHVAGVDVVGPLPPEIQLNVVQTVAIGAMAKDRSAVDALVRYFKEPPAVALIREEGLEPIGP
jgi:molybdate transport system substrate-binding protein